jgi:hypothetical protein
MGELREIDVVLRPVAAALDTMKVVLVQGVRADGGTATIVSERSLDRLPTLNRDLYDFVRLVPQISTKISLASPASPREGWAFASTTSSSTASRSARSAAARRAPPPGSDPSRSTPCASIRCCSHLRRPVRRFRGRAS